MTKRVVLYSLMLLIIAGLAGLNYYLWQTQKLKKQRIEGLQTQVGLRAKENKALVDRNVALLVDVENLRSPDAYYTYEEKAREDYGMIGQNETYFVLPDRDLRGLPDVPGLASETVNVVNPAQPSIELESLDTRQSAPAPTPPAETIPVSPVPLQLESLQ